MHFARRVAETACCRPPTSYYYQQQPDVAIGNDGRFVVTWSGHGVGGDYSGVYVQRLDSTGNPVGTETRVKTTIGGPQELPSVAVDAANNFVITWSGMGNGDLRGVFLQRFDDSGSPVGGEELVNTTTLYDQEDAVVSTAPSGSFVVTWTSSYQDGSGRGVYGQEYDSFGGGLGEEFLVNTTTNQDQRIPSVASKGDLGFVVAWSRRGADDSTGVFARSFNRPTVPPAPAGPSSASGLVALDQLFADDEELIADLIESLLF
jgi:hypothetical protein